MNAILDAVLPISPVPPITHPLGRSWDQPRLSAIIFEAAQCHMTRRTLEDLLEYSSSCPTGVYDGKMWRRKRREPDVWWLCWYGPCDDPTKCQIYSMPIVVL